MFFSGGVMMVSLVMCFFSPAGALSPQQTTSRRGFAAILTVPMSAALLGSPSSSQAAVPTTDELSKLTRGYERLQELLTNWDKITAGACGALMSKSEGSQIIVGVSVFYCSVSFCESPRRRRTAAPPATKRP